MKSLNIKETDKEMSLSYTVFQRIFCRSLFKESLIEVLREIEDGVNRKSKVETQTQPPKSQSMRYSQMMGDGPGMATVREMSIKTSERPSRMSNDRTSKPKV
jgi:hypothetical protein